MSIAFVDWMIEVDVTFPLFCVGLVVWLISAIILVYKLNELTEEIRSLK